MLENVTIVIPAHNRPERLQRLLNYYAGTGAKILVPDSSDKPFMGEYDRRRVVYRHLPRMHFFLKLREVISLIETEYVLWCADDDFAVPSGIAAVVDFLDKNPTFSIAQGHYLTFTPTAKGVKFYPRYIRNFGCRIEAPTAVERMRGEKGMYSSMLYGVTRSDIFKHIYSYCYTPEGELRFRNLYLAEEFFNHAMMIHGNYATVPVFYSARERIAGSAADTTVPPSVVKSAPEYAGEYNGYKTALAMMLADHETMAPAEAMACIEEASKAPVDKPAILFKRRVNAFLGRHRWLRWALALSDLRYRQKGLKAVRGMASYPCGGHTPETDAIERAVKSSM